jgi:hypothetical protein
MKNYYFVLSFNLTNPIIKSMISKQSIFVGSDQMLDLKLRSRPFMCLTESMIGAHKDASVKIDSIFNPDKKTPDYNFRHVCVMNPIMIMNECGESDLAEIASKFGPDALYNWDENCCGVLFFMPNGGAPIEEKDIGPDEWMLKYEIMYYEDSIESAGNGDFVFAPSNLSISSSALH